VQRAAFLRTEHVVDLFEAHVCFRFVRFHVLQRSA
jgi:hypothetical protein